ncbi:MAG: hypothetical protein EBR82_60495 [Caulobacteraceae bacterium]|nr:hypothetical protein [Caulobacteraceae bacterium]
MKHAGRIMKVPVAAAIAIAAGFLLGGCKARQSVSPSTPSNNLPAAVTTTKDSAEKIGTAATTIATHTHRIEVAAPDLHADTQPILGSVDDLRAVQAQLATTSVSLADENKRCKQLAEDLGKANAKIADLESDRDGLLYRLLTLGAVAGLGLAVVGGVWLRSLNAVLTGLGIFAACVAGQWIIAYRAAIAITALVLVGLVLAWKLLKEHLTATQLVTTIEAGKGSIADWGTFASVANSIQNKYTRRVVDRVQKSLGIKKAAKP